MWHLTEGIIQYNALKTPMQQDNAARASSFQPHHLDAVIQDRRLTLVRFHHSIIGLTDPIVLELALPVA